MNNTITLIKFMFMQNRRRVMSLIVSTLLFPLIFISSLSDNASPVEIKFLAIYFILLQSLINGFMNITISEAKNIETLFIRRLSVTPISKYQYLFASFISQGLITLLGTLIILAIALQKDAMTIKFSLLCILVFIISFGIFYLFGFIIAQKTRDVQVAKTYGMFAYIFLMIALTSQGKFFEFILKISGIHYMEQLYSTNDIVGNLTNLIIIYIVLLVIAKRVFKWE